MLTVATQQQELEQEVEEACAALIETEKNRAAARLVATAPPALHEKKSDWRRWASRTAYRISIDSPGKAPKLIVKQMSTILRGSQVGAPCMVSQITVRYCLRRERKTAQK